MHAAAVSQSVRMPGRSWGAKPMARLIAGASFKHEHLEAILAEDLVGGFFEVHAENYMGGGGAPHRMLAALRERHPLSVHGVGMSIGGPGALDAVHLLRFRDLVRRYEPALVSEHLAWSSHAGRFFNDLLPLPYTHETLVRVCEHVDQVQQAIQRTLLVENPATYVQFAASEMSETDFIREVARRTGCGLLLDINNVVVSATNHRYSPVAYMEGFPLEHVREIHLAGHAEQLDDEGEILLLDSHDRAVGDAVWNLYASIIERTGAVPTLVEWDSDLPGWPLLRDQVLRARKVMQAHDLTLLEGAGHGI